MTESPGSARARSILFGLQDPSSLTLKNIRTSTDTPDCWNDTSAQCFLEDMANTLEDPPFDDRLSYEERPYPPSSLLVDDDWPTRPSSTLYVLGLIIFFVLGAVSTLLAVALLL